MSTSRPFTQDETLASLRSNPYFDQGRIDAVPVIPEFDIKFEQIITRKKAIRCYVLSDIHADSEKNQHWVREKCKRRPEDVADDAFTIFIVPGDIGSEIDRIKTVLQNLVANYDAVCYLPGNHEAWRKGTAAGGSAKDVTSDPSVARPENRMATDSVAKLVEVLQCAEECGCFVGPLRVELAAKDNDDNADAAAAASGSSGSSGSSGDSGDDDDGGGGVSTGSGTRGVVVMPLYGWYHSSWDVEPPITDPQFLAVEAAVPFYRKWGDFSMCSWPAELISHEEFVSNPPTCTKLAEAFAKLNEPFLHPPPYSPSPSSSPSSNPPPYPQQSPSSLTTNPSSTLPAPPSSTRKDSSTNPSASSSSGTATIGSGGGGGGVTTTTASTTASSTSTSNRRQYLGSPIVQRGDAVISYSHYLPRHELCPEKRFLTEPLLAEVVGSDVMECQVRRLQPHLHLYGHTHIPLDLELDGIRYVQWPLGYHREAEKQCKPIQTTAPLLCYDTQLGPREAGIPEGMASSQTMWSTYYRTLGRDCSTPEKVNDLAPWVRQRLDQFSGFVVTKEKRDNNNDK